MTRIRIGDWTVVPTLNLLERDGKSLKLEPRAMDLLVYLATARERVVSADELLREVWQGRVFDDGVVYKKVNQLRKALGDEPQRPRFIETIPKRGYRLVADVVKEDTQAQSERQSVAVAVTRQDDTAAVPSPSAAPRSATLRRVALAATATVLLALTAFALLDDRPVTGEHLDFMPLSFQRDGSELRQILGSMVWSPDSKAIAFAARNRNATEPPQIYLRYFESPTPTPLAQMPHGGVPKAWTQSGQIVINLGQEPAMVSQSGGLWTAPAVGGQPEPLFGVPEGTTNLMDVSRDGKTVAVVRRGEDGLWGIWTAAIPAGTLERYDPAPFATPAFMNAPTLAFSPDGRQLLLMWNSDGSGEQAWLMPYPPDPVRPPHRVLKSLPQIYTPTFSWLPDNRHIVLSTAARDRPLRLYLADTISGRFRPFADAPSTVNQIDPRVSPDGTQLVFTELHTDLDIVTMDVNTMAVTELVSTNRVEQMPAWGGDPGMFVYMVDRDGEAEIWLHAATDEDRPLVTARDFEPDTTRYFMAPQLSPDGKRVAYIRVESDARGSATRMHIWISSLGGGTPMRLTESSASEVAGSWSPDGSWYVYAELNGDEVVSIKKARDSGYSEPVTLVPRARVSMVLPVWSPDGHWILYDDDGLKLISDDGELTRDLEIRNAICTFARAEPLLYCFHDLRRTPTFAVVGLDGSVRTTQPVARENVPATNGEPALRLSLTPDGRGITYSVDRARTRLLLVDGLAGIARP